MPAAPLLITASFDPGKTPQVALRNVEDRIRCHMEGLLAWLKDPGIGRIVFAKNCRVQIRKEVLLNVAVEHGKELEFLQADPSPRTVLQGKGFGEGDLIRQVLEKSAILKDADEFIKVTGKLYAPGWEKVFCGSGDGEFYDAASQSTKPNLRSWTRPLYRHENGGCFMCFLKRRIRVPWEFVAAAPLGWIDTRIYIVKKEFYRKNLLGSHRRVQDSLNYTLENAFSDDLRFFNDIRRIREAPVIIGISGSLSTEAGSFSKEIHQQAKNLTDVVLNVAAF